MSTSRILLAVDPGLRKCGVAVFMGGDLMMAEVVKNPASEGRGPSVWRRMANAVTKGWWLPPDTIAIEFPQAYVPGRQKGDQNDLIDLAGVAGAIVGEVSRAATAAVVVGYLPHEWKGQLPKKVANERVLKFLTPGERSRIVSLDHNLLDAVGVGLHHLGRFQLVRNT